MPTYPNGVFMGTTMLQRHETIGGARSVFVKLQGVKNDLVFPTHGGKLANPFKGKAKIFAGDLMEYRPDGNGIHPAIYLLKTFKVKSQASTKVVIYKDGFKHVPFVGDVLMKAPSEIGGKGKAYAITSIALDGDGNWELTFSTAIDSVSDGDVLVEAESSGANKAMLVKRINCVAPCDYDCFYDPASNADDFEGARYLLTPALAGLMYVNRMSPLPACVSRINKCDIPGWFKVDGLAAPEGAVASVAELQEQIDEINGKIDDIDDEFDIMNQSGAEAPTTATVGKIGSQYTVTASGSEALYVCTAITEGDTPTYTWTKMSPSA